MKMKYLFFRAPHRHTVEPAVGLTLKTARPLIDWREGGRELTLALNGLKYACTTVFFAVRPNDIPSLDDLSSPFRAFSSGINWLLPCVMSLMDNHFIFLDYSTRLLLKIKMNITNIMPW